MVMSDWFGTILGFVSSTFKNDSKKYLKSAKKAWCKPKDGGMSGTDYKKVYGETKTQSGKPGTDWKASANVRKLALNTGLKRTFLGRIFKFIKNKFNLITTLKVLCVLFLVYLFDIDIVAIDKGIKYSGDFLVSNIRYLLLISVSIWLMFEIPLMVSVVMNQLTGIITLVLRWSVCIITLFTICFVMFPDKVELFNIGIFSIKWFFIGAIFIIIWALGTLGTMQDKADSVTGGTINHKTMGGFALILAPLGVLLSALFLINTIIFLTISISGSEIVTYFDITISHFSLIIIIIKLCIPICLIIFLSYRTLKTNKYSRILYKFFK